MKSYLVLKTISVQWLVRSFGTHTQTDRQRSFYFIRIWSLRYSYFFVFQRWTYGRIIILEELQLYNSIISNLKGKFGSYNSCWLTKKHIQWLKLSNYKDAPRFAMKLRRCPPRKLFTWCPWSPPFFPDPATWPTSPWRHGPAYRRKTALPHLQRRLQFRHLRQWIQSPQMDIQQQVNTKKIFIYCLYYM